MDNQYKVGDKVRVIPAQTKYKHLFNLTNEMLDEFGGKEVTISYVGHYNKDKKLYITNQLAPCDNFIYNIKEDNGRYYWSNTMFMVV